MQVIDEHAEQRLSELLEQAASRLHGFRCLHLRLPEAIAQPILAEPPSPAANRNPSARQADLLLALRHALPSAANAEAIAYLTQDGDIFCLARHLMPKEMRELAMLLARWGMEPGCLVLHEIPNGLLSLRYAVDEKLEKIRQHDAARQAQLHQQELQRRKREILTPPSFTDGLRITLTRRDRANLQIMLVEDDHFSRRLVETTLARDYQVLGLGTAHGVLEAYALNAPDVLFLDIELPDVTGHELLRAILAMDPSAYVVMLSGHADRDNILQAMQLGAKGFVAKPFTRDKLVQYIRQCPRHVNNGGNHAYLA